MTTSNSLPSERAAVVAVINPTSFAAGANNSGWFGLQEFYRYLAIVQTGVLGTSATVDVKLQVADDITGTNPVDVTGSSVTQVVKATGDNKQVEINFDPANLGQTIKKAARLVVTVGTAASLASGVVLGFDDRNAPASNNDLSSVAQILTV